MFTWNPVIRFPDDFFLLSKKTGASTSNWSSEIQKQNLFNNSLKNQARLPNQSSNAKSRKRKFLSINETKIHHIMFQRIS